MFPGRLRHWLLILAITGMAICIIPSPGADFKSPIAIPSEPDAQGIALITLPTSETIERADLYFREPHLPDDAAAKGHQPTYRAILVLVPGRNGNGRNLIAREDWQTFADENHLLLCGVSFASDNRFVETSYSNAQSGSGEMILTAIDHFVASKQPRQQKLPIYLFGFSAGARFTASFVDLYPQRIGAWCAYSVGRWEPASETKIMPPGIVVSGEYDAGCYHASLLYFQEGRKHGKPWMWLSLKETGHQLSPQLDDFVRAYFHEVIGLDDRNRFVSEGHYRDIDTKKMLTEEQMQAWPIFATWLPKGNLAERWLKVHHP